MGDLGAFAQEVESRIRRAQTEPSWSNPGASQYMAKFGERRNRFDEEARHLTSSIIGPRLEKVTDCFSNAALDASPECGNPVRARFGFCERFPVSAQVEFRVDHDVNWTCLFVQYEVCISPAFPKSNANDRLTLPLEGSKQHSDGDSGDAGFGPVGKFDQAVADWVEKRLLEFIDSYHQLDRGCDFFDEDTATDPVCGMRLKRSQAIKSDFRKHQYFFCSSECEATFVGSPEKFIEREVI